MAKKKAAKKSGSNGTQVVVAAPNIQTAEFHIRGTAPYVQNAFPKKATEEMKAKQMAGDSEASEASEGGTDGP